MYGVKVDDPTAPTLIPLPMPSYYAISAAEGPIVVFSITTSYGEDIEESRSHTTHQTLAQLVEMTKVSIIFSSGGKFSIYFSEASNDSSS